MKTIPPGFYERLDRLMDAGVLCWAMTIELDFSEALYLTNNNRAIERHSQTYTPYPFKVGTIADSGDGDLPTTTLTLSNVGRFPMPYLEGGRFDGARVILEIAYLPDLTIDILELEAFGQHATATEEAVTVTLGQPNWFERLYPGIRWLRTERFPGIPRNIH